ncbi:FMN-binding negative transcriptional regulator [Constantimarinum furrinae]|uniref:Transcriptional regulator n=1 Tax=Constantimarinum furrinae TaxID=2562285 RepID=A0A7G8PUK1_9FLAO|nr:FMN-binding negative transcriptional regulator [Constantimarinum furrinae]QNJ98017.1 Transcriptional regulator [Constantimarinum furrinae]
MYPPPYHQTRDIDKMIAVIKKFPLGMLVTANNSQSFITHIPFIYHSETEKLVAHIDKANPQVATLKDGAEVTVVFKGPDTYISPAVYTTRQLPTWNYIIVHITGTIRLINDAEAAKDTMITMTEFLEGSSPGFILKKENEAMNRFVNYIQAFEISVTNWEGKFKLSQDKIEQDQLNAKHALIENTHSSLHSFIEKIYS